VRTQCERSANAVRTLCEDVWQATASRMNLFGGWRRRYSARAARHSEPCACR